MNMTVDAQRPVSGRGSAETATITYRPSAHANCAGKAQRSGYTLDIADKVMDNEAYGGHGMTAEEMVQQIADPSAQSKKDFMIVMSSCVSGEDLQKMQEEGFNPGNTDVETYVTIVDRIKVTLAQAGVEVAGYNDNLDISKIEEITGSRAGADALVRQLSDALIKNDVPVTGDNIAELADAVMEAAGIGGLADDAVKYLIVNGLTPTIENVYKAQHSSAADVRQPMGYYSDCAGSYGKYYARKADEINWDNLEGQIENVVRQAGLDADAGTKAQAAENAKWLVSNGIELNAANLTKLTRLRDLELPMGQGEIAEMCVTALANGKAPKAADMTGEMSAAGRAREIVEQVAAISDEAIHDTVESGKEINIKNLSEAQRRIEARDTAGTKAVQVPDENIASENQLKEVQARRQLEEIRLMMTEEANRRLIRAGISVDTTELAKLVESLRAAEEGMRSILFQGGDAAENERRALLYEDTLTTARELADMPAAVIGKIMPEVQQSTLLDIHVAGKQMQQQMQLQMQGQMQLQVHLPSQSQPGDANSNNNGNNNSGQSPNPERQEKATASAIASYETLMTGPRKDLGDRISKAFRNIDDILADLGLETSDANRRAVRILGYNSMEITEKNIDAVKAADSQVTGVIGRMTPAAALQMIREQKNPLEMTMAQIEEYLDSRDADPAMEAEKYSKFLLRLERSREISGEEREAYMGIYRMFRQIEKSDGAVIGSIVATGAQMNFKNMLSAVRSATGKNMDVRVDDGFGALEELIAKGKAIDAQINAGYEGGGQNNNFAGRREAEKYYARLSGEINGELSRNTDFDMIDTDKISSGTTIEQFADTVRMARVPDDGEARAREKAEDLRHFQSAMHEVEQIDGRIIDTLISFGQSVSVDNIQAASMLIFERGALFKKVIGGGKNDESLADGGEADTDGGGVLEMAEGFVESLTDTKAAKAAYQEIIEEANKAVGRMVYEDASSHIDVRAAHALYKGLLLAGNLAREENYEVPMEINGEITSVNLKIYHNAPQTGKVAVTFETDKFGKVAAEFDVTDKRVSGMVAYENRAGKPDLEQLSEAVGRQLGAAGGKEVAVNLVQANSVDLNKFGQDRRAVKGAKIPTAELYRTAKSFLTALNGI